jgi:hypothetical protein
LAGASADAPVVRPRGHGSIVERHAALVSEALELCLLSIEYSEETVGQTADAKPAVDG